MQIAIELDLPAIISQAVSAERIQPLVDKAISEAVKAAISDATGYSSEFRKTLEKQLKEVMPHGLGIDDLAKFQHIANAAFSEVVRSANNETIKTAIAKAVKAAVPEVPVRIKLSEFMKEARRGFHKEDHEEFYANLKMSDYGGGWLSLDSDESTRSPHGASTRISFNKDGEVYSVRFDGVDVKPTSVPNAVGDFDGLLLSMYVGRTSIDIDIDEVDVESLTGDQTDY